MNLLNIPDYHISSIDEEKITYDFNLTVFTLHDKVRFDIDGTATSWMGIDDGFVERIRFENLNRCFLSNHLAKEIEIKNILDEGIMHLKSERYPKAIECFDEAILYDEGYGEALLLKSHSLFGQKHFVKALRHYKKAINTDGKLKDIEYHKMLLEKANEERSSFPKIKSHIYAGDEHFASGDYAMAIESYDKALANPSKFKSRILHKLLNKKATALFEMESFSEALDCFESSLQVQKSDYAVFMRGRCRHKMNLTLDDSFIRDLRITKPQKLCKAMILIDVKMYEDAIKCIDDLLSSHFAPDDLYFKALSSKISAMQSLDMDVGDEIALLEKVRKG